MLLVCSCWRDTIAFSSSFLICVPSRPSITAHLPRSITLLCLLPAAFISCAIAYPLLIKSNENQCLYFWLKIYQKKHNCTTICSQPCKIYLSSCTVRKARLCTAWCLSVHMLPFACMCTRDKMHLASTTSQRFNCQNTRSRGWGMATHTDKQGSHLCIAGKKEGKICIKHAYAYLCASVNIQKQPLKCETEVQYIKIVSR